MTRETLVYNSDGHLVAVLPSDGISRAWPEDADPARVVLQLDLLPSEDVEPYLYVEGRIAESAKARVAKPERSKGMVLRSLGANEFGFAGAHRLTNGQMRLTVTNGANVAEIYSYTVWHTSTVVVTTWTNEYDEVITGTNLVWHSTSPPFDGIESAWECQTTNLVLSGGVGTWDDADVPTNARVRFYAAAQRADTDADGLTDGAEIFLHRTDPEDPDTDGDGIPDGAEIDLNLNPVEPSDAMEDPDGDGFSNLLEYQLGSPLDNPAWSGEQLVHRLMHANTNHGLRVEVEDSENCGGTGLTQYVTNSLSVPDLLDCGYFLDITVAGNVEDHMSLYDHVYVRALDEKFYFGGDQNYVACSPVAKTGTLNHLILPNSQITLIYDTVSYKHHVNGYAEITGAAVTGVIKVDLAAADLDGAVADATEETTGAYVYWNLDNDDASDNSVGAPNRSGADYLQTGAAKVTGEDDLKFLAMSLQPDLNQGSVVLNIANDKAKVWKDAEKGSTNLVLAGPGDKTWNLADAGQKADFISLCPSLWVEGVDGGTCDIKLSFKDTYGAEICSDKVKYTFIAADCGNQPTTTGTPSQRDKFEGAFPNLKRCEWSVTAGESPAYNCIAYSAGITDRWVDKTIFVPGVGFVSEAWDGLGNHHVSIDKMYGDGDNVFEMSDLDAFYSTEAGLSPTATGPGDATAMYYDGYHAARKKGCACGSGKSIIYESKCGPAERIEHVHDQLDGSAPAAGYGARCRYYK